MNANVYHSSGSEKIEAILRSGFMDSCDDYYERKRGVRVTRCPHQADPNYPDIQILEISLSAEVNLAPWELALAEGPNPWGEWVVPARILNEYAKVRLLTPEQWQQAWERWEQDWIQSHR